MSGFLKGLLSGESFEVCGKYGNANGAIVVSRHGCAPAMASWEELEFFLNNFNQNKNLLNEKPIARLHKLVERGQPRKQPLFILAFDHRSQFEKSCAEYGLNIDVISQFKEQIYAGFLLAKEKIKSGAAILIDPIYGKNILQKSAYENFTVGVPIEEAGSFPLRWISKDPLCHEILHRPKRHFVKVLWQFHRDLPSNLKEEQLLRLQEVHEVCERLNRKLMVELIIPEKFSQTGQDLANAIEETYRKEVFPFWWKIPAVNSSHEWQTLTSIMDEYDPNVGVVILGQGESIEKFEDWFSIVRKTPHAVGFAVGRTIFWEAWEKFAARQIPESVIPGMICERYLKLIQT